MCDRIRLGVWRFAGHRDYETAGLRDCGTTRPQDTLKNTGVLSRSQSFPVVLSSAWQLGVRVVQMWYQVEVWLDGGVLGRTSPFGQTSLVPQMRRYHAKLKFVVRSRKMWCQVEVGLDGGVLGRTSPFRQMRVVPQMTPYHNKL